MATAGMPYSLPKGVVPVQVFIDENGVGVTIEPATVISDSQAGILVARLKPSPFNEEDMKLAADPATGFLTTISSDSKAKLQEIVEEIAKTAGRLSLQNSKALFFSRKVVVLSDRFDPLDAVDVSRINVGIRTAMERAARAFTAAGGQLGAVPEVTLSLDGAAATAPTPGPAVLRNCELGVCVRAMTSRTIRVSIDGASVDTKNVNLPSREIIPVPVPQTILANQKITVTIKDGILSGYDLKRDSEVLGLVKTVGAIPGAFVEGLFAGLDAEKGEIDKEAAIAGSKTTLVDRQIALTEALKKQADANIKLQNTTGAGAGGAYKASVLTVYPFPSSLTSAVRQQRARPAGPPAGVDGLTDPAPRQ